MTRLYTPTHTTLQTVDRFNNLYVNAFATPGGARLLLLHDGRGDDAVRAFLSDAYEAYVRVRGSAGGRGEERALWWWRW